MCCDTPDIHLPAGGCRCLEQGAASWGQWSLNFDWGNGESRERDEAVAAAEADLLIKVCYFMGNSRLRNPLGC